MLKICDTLREWNKTKASDETDYITPDEIIIKLESNKIILKKYPKKRELIDKIEQFFINEKIVQFD